MGIFNQGRTVVVETKPEPKEKAETRQQRWRKKNKKHLSAYIKNYRAEKKAAKTAEQKALSILADNLEK